MSLIRSCIVRRARFGVNQALRPTATPPPQPTSTSGLMRISTPAPSGPMFGSSGSLLSRRHLRVTRTHPQTPPMPPIDLRYNYAAVVFVVVLFTWAALTPEDDGFNTLLRGGANSDDEDDEDDDDERYDGAGYEGRDKAMAGSGDGGTGEPGGRSRNAVAAVSRPVERD